MLTYPLVKRMHGVLVMCENEDEHQKFLRSFDKMDTVEGYNQSIRTATVIAAELNRKNKDLVNIKVD